MTSTINFGFTLIGRDYQPWHDKEHNNWRTLDALLARYLSLSNLQGVWENATAYALGDRVVDSELGTIWEALAPNTSASTGTFAADRSARPTLWASVSFQVNARGTWTTNTAYQVNDFVVSGNIYAACIIAHTSGATFAGDSARWAYILDLTSAVTSINASVVAAESSAQAVQDIVDTLNPPFAISIGGTGASTASGAITALGLGDLALLSAVGTTQIDDDAVSFAKMQNIVTNSLIGRDTASTGSPENILLDDTLEMDGSGNLQRAALTGDVTAPAGSNVMTLATVNSNVGTFTNPSVTANAKGLITAISNGAANGYTALTAYTTPGSGQTSRGWTGIPSTATSIILRFAGMSCVTNSHYYIQIGDSGGLEITGYEYNNIRLIQSGPTLDDVGQYVSQPGWFISAVTAATATYNGVFMLDLIDPSTNTWLATWDVQETAESSRHVRGWGQKALSGTLDRISIVCNSSTFDALTFANVFYK